MVSMHLLVVLAHAPAKLKDTGILTFSGTPQAYRSYMHFYMQPKAIHGRLVGLLVVLGSTTLWDIFSVYIEPSPRQGKKEKR